MFKISAREINKKYTKSDLVLIGWDSRQKAYNMSVHMEKSRRGYTSKKVMDNVAKPNVDIEETAQAYIPQSEDYNNGMPVLKSLINDEGELDLRLANDKQAINYMRGLGINIMGF